jgi:hypothetical protein
MEKQYKAIQAQVTKDLTAKRKALAVAEKRLAKAQTETVELKAEVERLAALETSLKVVNEKLPIPSPTYIWPVVPYYPEQPFYPQPTWVYTIPEPIKYEPPYKIWCGQQPLTSGILIRNGNWADGSIPVSGVTTITTVPTAGFTNAPALSGGSVTCSGFSGDFFVNN